MFELQSADGRLFFFHKWTPVPGKEIALFILAWIFWMGCHIRNGASSLYLPCSVSLPRHLRHEGIYAYLAYSVKVFLRLRVFVIKLSQVITGEFPAAVAKIDSFIIGALSELTLFAPAVSVASPAPPAMDILGGEIFAKLR
jgi:hypothetical protein